MNILPITRTSPVDDVAEVLRDEVLGGSHPLGSRLDEPDVQARLEVPRSLARSALAVLEREGLLVHSLHRGLEVARLSVIDVRDLYATRRTWSSRAWRRWSVGGPPTTCGCRPRFRA